MTISRRELTVKPVDVSVVYGTSTELAVEYVNFAPGEDSESSKRNCIRLHTVTLMFPNKAPGVYTIFAHGAYGDNYIVTHTTGTVNSYPSNGNSYYQW